MFKKVEVFFLKDSQGRYTNGLALTDKWRAMKPGNEVQNWLYVGAQRGKIFDFEVGQIPLSKEAFGDKLSEEIAAWEDQGFVVRDILSDKREQSNEI